MSDKFDFFNFSIEAATALTKGETGMVEFALDFMAKYIPTLENFLNDKVENVENYHITLQVVQGKIIASTYAKNKVGDLILMHENELSDLLQRVKEIAMDHLNNKEIKETN